LERILLSWERLKPFFFNWFCRLSAVAVETYYVWP
jgi:hypothetical protein